ncbi:hypothetical protein ACFL6S_08650 [Candidatus Poribacteria bacterium]
MEKGVLEALDPIELDDVEQNDTVTDHSDADKDQDLDVLAQEEVEQTRSSDLDINILRSDVIHCYKSEYMCFAGIKPDGDHNVYLSGYGLLASALLGKYLEDQRDDNKKLFAEWDKSLQEAASQAGFSATHEVEDGYVYISSFQNGIGISAEEEAILRKNAAKRVYDELEYGSEYDRSGYESEYDESEDES